MGVLFLLLIPSVYIVQQGGNDIRNRAAGSGEVDIGIDTGSPTYSAGNQFTIQIAMRKIVSRTIVVSGAQAVVDVPLSVFSISSATCIAPFNGTPFVSITGPRVTLFCALSPGAPVVDLSSSPTIFGSISLSVNPDAALGTSQLTFAGTRATEANIQGQSPDVSTAGTNATITIVDAPVATPTPTITLTPVPPTVTPTRTPTPIPSPTRTPTPTATWTPTPTATLTPIPNGPSLTPTLTPSPTPTTVISVIPTVTPPFNTDDYLISIGTKDSLTINIGAGEFMYINFKTKLAHVENTPDLILRMRVKDELAFTQNPPSTTDTCQTPGTGSRDFYIPVKADESGAYSPSSSTSVTAPSGITLATVELDGWVRLPGLNKDKFYTITLKGPKTRGTKMIEHLKLEGDKPASQDFDWTGNPLFPGDLPDPNNTNRQDCTVNSIDLSLMVDRQGNTDGAALDIADVTYDGVVNGNDISKVVNTLSTKPDDD